MRVSLAGRFTLGLAVLMALVAAVGGVTLWSVSRLAADARAVERAHEARTRMALYLSSLTDVETAMRGFVVSGREEFLAPLRRAAPTLDEQGRRLLDLAATPAERERVEQLTELARVRLRLAEEAVAVRRALGEKAAARLVSEGRGRQVHEDVRALVRELDAAETARLAARREATERTARVALVLVVGSLAAAAVALAVALVSVHRSLALRAEAEARLRESHDRLEIERDRAQAADRVKSAFLATMSHELRTPLNSIIGFTGLLLQRLPGPLNDEQARQLGMVRDSARHLLELINDVLDLSKIEAGELAVQARPFDVRPSLEKVAGLVRPLAERKGLGLDATLGPDLGAWTGDARRFEQVVLNLLTNAIKFTEHGRVTLSVRRGEGRLAVSVADTGPGIAAEDLATLFRPFRQLDSGIDRRAEGTGLGLAISQRLARLMGGHVSVSSEPGRGSVFTLELDERGGEAA